MRSHWSNSWHKGKRDHVRKDSSMHLALSMADQSLSLFEGAKLIKSYIISTAAKGMGCQAESFRTPTGRFFITEKIGEDAPIYTIFKSRKPVGILTQNDASDGDLITTRIIRIHGADAANANTFDRCVYIHGTNQEHLLGSPSSHGCIRLSNSDVIDLFSRVTIDTPLTIYPTHQKGSPIVFIDCDSTLSSIEGIDELGRAKGAEIFKQVEALTHAAMNGEVPISDVFASRMEIIKPDAATCEKVAQLYIDSMVPHAKETIAALKNKGWIPVIISGGFAPLIAPLAKLLEIDFIEAVPLYFDENGQYAGYGSDFPTTRNGGKSEIINAWKAALNPSKTIMIGDGVSDAETRNDVDVFIGFGGVVARESVKKISPNFIEDFSKLLTYMA